MTDRFDQIIKSVKRSYKKLLDSPKYTLTSFPKNIPSAGIYFFSEKGKPLYVGRTNKLRKRLQYHTRNNHNQATFAFLLARHKTGRLRAAYKQKGSRQDLLNDPKFRAAFDEARARIKKMDVQFVEEPDPIKQTILEVFAAFESKAKFNDFNTH